MYSLGGKIYILVQNNKNRYLGAFWPGSNGNSVIGVISGTTPPAAVVDSFISHDRKRRSLELVCDEKTVEDISGDNGSSLVCGNGKYAVVTRGKCIIYMYTVPCPILA